MTPEIKAKIDDMLDVVGIASIEKMSDAFFTLAILEMVTASHDVTIKRDGDVYTVRTETEDGEVVGLDPGLPNAIRHYIEALFGSGPTAAKAKTSARKPRVFSVSYPGVFICARTVIIADDEAHARELFKAEIPDVDDVTFEELTTAVTIITDGDY